MIGASTCYVMCRWLVGLRCWCGGNGSGAARLVMSGAGVERNSPRQTLTARAKRWVTRRVGRDGESVAVVARSLGVGWWSIMQAVAEVAYPGDAVPVTAAYRGRGRRAGAGIRR
jgi:hypothetical protein